MSNYTNYFMASNSAKTSNEDGKQLKSTRAKGSAFKSFLYKIGQTAILGAFLLGLCSLNGKEISVFTFLNNVISVFSVNRSLWYYHVSSTIQGLLYFVFGLKITAGFFRNINSWKIKDIDKQERTFKTLLNDSLVYLILCAGLNPIKITIICKIVFFISVIFLIITNTITQMTSNDKISLKFIITNPVILMLKVIIIFMTANIFMNNVVDGFINGFYLLRSINFKSFGTTLYILFESLVLPIFKLVFSYRIIRIINSICEDDIEEETFYWKALTKLTITVFVIDFILYIGCVTIGDSVNIFDMLLSYFANSKTKFIPFALLGIAGSIAPKQLRLK